MRALLNIFVLLVLGLGLIMSFVLDDVPMKPLKINSKKMLDRHNHYRKEVGVAPLIWSEDLTNHAQIWADSLALTCAFEHQDGHYGENIFWTTIKNKNEKDVVDFWAREKKYVNEENLIYDDKKSKKYRHYSQIVWEKTTELGAARQRCENGDEIWVCVYSPKGNIQGEQIYTPKTQKN